MCNTKSLCCLSLIDTNSEIENEAKFSDYVLPNGHHQPAPHNYHNHPPQQEFLVQPNLNRDDPPICVNKNTGAIPKPKQLSVNNKSSKPSKQITNGDNVFRISTNLNNNFIDANSCRTSTSYSSSSEIYNVGASSSRETYHSPRISDLKIHKSPSKSSSHHSHKHLRLQEEQNDQFLFEIEPIKPRNSVTIYTTNCDEKILIDALVGWDVAI